MFLFVVLVGILLHAYMLTPLRSATDRQLQLKSEYLYKTMETAWVEPYTESYLKAAADNLVLTTPTVPGEYLRSAMENALGYLLPQDHAVEITLTHENGAWKLIYPDVGPPAGKRFAHSGSISVTRAEAENERTILVQVTLTLFRVG
jgi:hypothetical protein